MTSIEANKNYPIISLSCLIFILYLLFGATHPLAAQDTISLGESKSGYDKIEDAGGANSVHADLKDDDKFKHAWLSLNYTDKIFKKYYSIKRKLNDKYRIALGTDYMFLNQYASFSNSETHATSGIFRFFGTWEAIKVPGKHNGSLIIKIENRHSIGNSLTPRNLGYEAGSALSTASFKHFSWGMTNFYWKQMFLDKYIFTLGIMDAGDWIDLYPMLNPFKYYLNEAFFNSPAMALPNQGVGATIAVRNIISNFYIAGGIQDANGDPSYFLIDNFKSFFSVNEFFYWVEAGWDSRNSILVGETIHLTYWSQDARSEAEKEKSSGWCFSASKVFHSFYTVFIRAAISNGDAAVMHHLIKGGISAKTFRSDRVGIGLSWGGPNDRTRRDQFGLEAFYNIQLTQHLTITPDLQITLNPSFNEERDVLGVYSAFRLRYAL